MGMETMLALLTVVSLLSAITMAAFAYRLNERWYEQLEAMNANWRDFCFHMNESWADHQVKRVMERLEANSKEP